MASRAGCPGVALGVDSTGPVEGIGTAPSERTTSDAVGSPGELEVHAARTVAATAARTVSRAGTARAPDR
jgi:hypothetical protein